jgi:pentatricopeptide repeat protein
MEQKVKNLKCLGCGAPISAQQKRCRYCKREIYISSFSSVLQQSEYDFARLQRFYKESAGQEEQNPDLCNAQGMCYMRLGQYDKAYTMFEEAIRRNFDKSETYFLAAAALMQGKNPFKMMKKDVDRAITLLTDAASIENAPVYYYFLAYLTYDYYGRKFLRAKVPWQVWMQKAVESGLSTDETKELHTFLHTPQPDALKIENRY